MTVYWLTTAPNPRSPATGFDAGQRGWKRHAVECTSDSFEAIKNASALCGLTPVHGWSMDMFIDDKCARCVRKAVT